MVASSKANEALAKAMLANSAATTQVAAAVNANTARVLTAEQLEQAQAYATAQRVLEQLAKVAPAEASRFGHLVNIVVLRNPDLAKLVIHLETIEKSLGQKGGPSEMQLKAVISLLEQIVPARKTAMK